MFGGATISLILPKLIRSVARDGIFSFLFFGAANPPRRNFHLTTQGKPAVFHGQLANTQPKCTTNLKLSKGPAFRGDKMGRRQHAAAPKTDELLDFDLRASFFKLLLGGVGVSLVRAFEERLGSAFNQSLGFGETQTGLHFANDLDDGDLLVRRNGREDHVEGVFCSSGGRSSA